MSIAQHKHKCQHVPDQAALHHMLVGGTTLVIKVTSDWCCDHSYTFMISNTMATTSHIMRTDFSLAPSSAHATTEVSWKFPNVKYIQRELTMAVYMCNEPAEIFSEFRKQYYGVAIQICFIKGFCSVKRF